MKVNEVRVRKEYEKLTKYLIEHKLTITTMESCTAGQIISLITDTEGASAITKGGFVTYSNEAKMMQGVSAEVIDTYGVYSKETALEMARVCREAYKADIGIGVTGTFGNVDLNNKDSIPGQVFFAIDMDGDVIAYERILEKQESRNAYKMAIAMEIIKELLESIEIIQYNG